MSDSKSDLIRKLNDAFRKTFSGGKVVTTAAVDALDPEIKAGLFAKIRLFDDFTKDNDPYGEHDFGAVEMGGEKFFWKIDYYDKNLKYGSEEPSDPKQTRRVLTIMYASEY